jgi:DNA replication and repair protein RecF
VHLKRVTITQFKNYPTVSVDWSPGVNCLTGQNGMGKTNMLEAIYYLCMCRSCRRLTDRQLPTHGSPFFRLDGVFALNAEESGRVVAKVGAGKKKVFEWNGTSYTRLADHIGRLPVVAVLPEDTSIVTEGSEGRRNFFDTTFSQIDRAYLTHLITYNRLLQQRTSLVKTMATNRQWSEEMLDTYDRQMLEPARVIFRKRQEYAAAMAPVFTEYYKLLADDREEASYTYRSQLQDGDWMELMQSCREKDRVLQRTTSGLHRDDWQFHIGAEGVKRFASQGQVKSVILALKLAQYTILSEHHGFPPILLLDDLFDKLDAGRASRLLALLARQSFGQVFLTDTDQDRIAAIARNFQADFRMFTVHEALITPIAAT